MPSVELRIERLERKARGDADIYLPALFEKAADSPGIPTDDRRRLREMATDWRTTGGKKYARLLSELTDEGLDALGELRNMSWRTAPREHAGLFLSLADDPELSDEDRESCRKLGERLRAGRIGFENAIAELSDAALDRAAHHRIRSWEERAAMTNESWAGQYDGW